MFGLHLKLLLASEEQAIPIQHMGTTLGPILLSYNMALRFWDPTFERPCPTPPPLQCREHEPPQHCTFFLSEGHVLKINIQRTTKKQTSTNQPAERIPLLVWTTLSLSIWPGLSNWNHVFDGSIADVPEGMQPSGFV